VRINMGAGPLPFPPEAHTTKLRGADPATRVRGCFSVARP